jgi:SAM-dependent methyltransferase
VLADRFLPFAALHHGLEINSPISVAMLEEAVAAMKISSTDRVLDIACGNGGLLWRLAERTRGAVGIDLSPWAIEAAAERLEANGVDAQLVLGDAAALPGEPMWDAIACVGAAWIFHGHAGTARALQRRLVHGGVALLGDLRARVRTPDLVVATKEEQHSVIRELGGRVLFDTVSRNTTWDAYGADVLAAAQRFAIEHAGVPAADQRGLADRWIHDALHERDHLEFALTVVRFHR